MKTAETVFVIPTYRLRDVIETIETYDEHFWSNGHSVKMIVFDDSSLANHEKYFSRLEHTKTTNELYYVGPREKEQFLCFLNKKLRDRKMEPLAGRSSFQKRGDQNCAIFSNRNQRHRRSGLRIHVPE
jgi:hypothetical protein